MNRCCVYEAFETDRLLYVGLSKHWPKRWVSHSGDKGWWQSVTLLRVTWYDSRDEAQRREGELIRLMRPPYNIVIPGEPRKKTWTDYSGSWMRCSLCPCGYSSELRPDGSVCGDLTWQWDQCETEEEMKACDPCQGICLREDTNQLAARRA